MNLFIARLKTTEVQNKTEAGMYNVFHIFIKLN